MSPLFNRSPYEPAISKLQAALEQHKGYAEVCRELAEVGEQIGGAYEDLYAVSAEGKGQVRPSTEQMARAQAASTRVRELTRRQEELTKARDGLLSEFRAVHEAEIRSVHEGAVMRMAKALRELAAASEEEVAVRNLLHEALDCSGAGPVHPLDWDDRHEGIGKLDDPNSTISAWFREARSHGYRVG